MNHIRHINLFEKICRVRPEYCFFYNSGIVFILERNKIARALGENGRNIKKLNEILGKKIKVVFKPESLSDVKEFISIIIHPAGFKDVEVGEEIVINAGRINKAGLIGRNKARLMELQEIVKEYFNKSLRII